MQNRRNRASSLFGKASSFLAAVAALSLGLITHADRPPLADRRVAVILMLIAVPLSLFAGIIGLILNHRNGWSLAGLMASIGVSIASSAAISHRM
jgi:hypothetical protein